jgi:hypothetical protein
MRLQAMLGKHGSRGAWSKYVEQVSELQWGNHGINLENDSVFNQVFRGVPKCGHYSLLIIDRTVDKLGRLVFLDSLPDMFHDTMDILQSIPSGTPLAPEGCKWICASMPRQGIQMMDCGIFMACAWHHCTQKPSCSVLPLSEWKCIRLYWHCHYL